MIKKNNNKTKRQPNKKTNVSQLGATILLLFFFSGLSYSCRENYTPRPYGYYRVAIPEHDYLVFDSVGLPYKFDISKAATVKPNNRNNEKHWIDVVYPTLNGKIHGSYKAVHNNLFELSEDTWKFVSAHTSRADDMSRIEFGSSEKSVYGILYTIKGNVASPVQFVLTDSVKHFFRGALYFDNKPNKDSIAPMLNYIHEDIVRLMETFEWKE